MELNQPISSVMTRDPICLGPVANLKQVEEAFRNNQFRHLPVVEGGILVGILSKTDITCFKRGVEMTSPHRHAHISRSARVLDLMTSKPVTLAPDATIRDAMTIFSKSDFHAIPVVEGKRVIGIFTTRDLFRLISQKRISPGLEPHSV